MNKRRRLRMLCPILFAVCMMAIAFMPSLAWEVGAEGEGTEGEPVAQVIRTEDNTLTFISDSKAFTTSDTYKDQKIKAVWRGDVVTNTGDDGPGWNSSGFSIKSVVFDESFKDITPKSTYKWFSDFSNLTEFSGWENLNTSNVENMSYMFSGCKALTDLDVSGLETSSVEDMSYMFSGCKALTNLDVSGLETLSATDMSYMFSDCEALESITFGANFSTSNVTNMSYMFKKCSGLKSLDVSKFDTPNVTTMSYMFSECSSLTSLDVSGFNTSNVEDMSRVFSSCGSLTNITFAEDLDTSKVTTMSNMFAGCNSLTSLDVSKFETTNVTDMSFMFSGCKTLTSLDLSKFNTSNVTTMTFMFSNCSNLTSLDLSSFDTSKVKSFRYMFERCSGLTSMAFAENFDTSSATNMQSMFDSCSGLTSLDVSKFDTSSVTDMSRMFYGCSGLTSLDIGNFETSALTEMWFMFNRCSGLKSMTFGEKFDTSSVTDMKGAFYDCSNLEKVIFGEKFNTLNVTTMYNMFHGCSSLTSLDVSKFDTSNVTDMSFMFYECSSLTSLDVSNFDTSKVTTSNDMQSMFSDCDNLKRIYCTDDKTDWEKTSEFRLVFSGSTKLVGEGGNGGTDDDVPFNYDYDTGYSGNMAKSVTDGGYFTPLTNKTVTFDANKPDGATAAPTGVPKAQEVTPGYRATDPATLSTPEIPACDGYVFDGWYTDKKCTNAYDFSQEVNTDFDLYAKWLIAIEEVEITDITEPAAGQELDTEWETSTDGVNEETINVSYTKDGEEASGKVAYNTTYTAAATLTPQDGYVFVDPVTITGADGLAGTVEENGKKLTITGTFAIPKAELQKIEFTSDAIPKPSRTPVAELKGALPSQVQLVIDGDDNEYYGTVAWNESAFDNYDATKLYKEDYPITVTGTVDIPDYIEQGGISNSIEQKFVIKAAGTVEAPVISITPAGQNGKYETDVTVGMTTTTGDAAIYYTLDGTDPSQGREYEGEIKLTGKEGTDKNAPVTASYTIKAYAKKADMFDSDSATETVAITIPVEDPEAKITVKNNIWKTLLKTITFKKFFKDNQEVKIEASDNYSDSVSIGYHKSKKVLTDAELADVKWDPYPDGGFYTNPNSKNVIYAKVVDGAGNATIINTDGIVIYTDSEIEKKAYEYTQNINMKSVEVAVDFYGNTVDAISNKEGKLSSDVDYTVEYEEDGQSGTITFSRAYLDSLNAGENKLTISYKPMGEDYAERANNASGDDDNNAPVAEDITLRIIATQENSDGSRISDEDGGGTFGDNEDKTYIPVGDEDDPYIKVTPNDDGSYKEEGGNPESDTDDTYYIPVDTDGKDGSDDFIEVKPNPDGSFTDEGNKDDKDDTNDEDKTYIPVDKDNNKEPDEFVEVKKGEDGLYEDDADGDGKFGENESKNGETDDNSYIPMNDDNDPKPERYIEVTPNDDGSFTYEDDPEKDDDDKIYIPIDKDKDGDIDENDDGQPDDFVEVKKNDDSSYTDPKDPDDPNDEDKTYIPVDNDNDGIPDEFIEVKKNDEDDPYKDDDNNNGTFGDEDDTTYVPVDDNKDDIIDRYVPKGTHMHTEKKAATCTEPALCGECGENYGRALGHDWNKCEPLKTSPAKHQWICSRDKTHIWTEDHDPTLECGKNTKCKHCEAEGANLHEYDEDNWKSDSEHHWHECIHCGKRKDGTVKEHDYNKTVDKEVPQTCPTCEYGGHITQVKLGEDFTNDDIPYTLKKAGVKTIDDIKTKMRERLQEEKVEVKTENTALYDATLEYSLDGGDTWYPASPYHFPDDGRLSVTMPVPEGTGIDTHEYTVLHMFSSNDFGKEAGNIEMPRILETKEDGKECIKFYVTGLSPIMVTWKATTLDTARSIDDGNGNDSGGIPIDDDNDGDIDHYITEDEFDPDEYVPIDKDGDGDIDHYVPRDKFDEDKYVPIDVDGDEEADHYVPNGVLTDPDGDGIYTPDGKKGPKYEAVDIDGDGVIDIFLLLDDEAGSGIDSGDDSDMSLWLLLMMTALTAGAITVAGRRYRKN